MQNDDELQPKTALEHTAFLLTRSFFAALEPIAFELVSLRLQVELGRPLTDSDAGEIERRAEALMNTVRTRSARTTRNDATGPDDQGLTIVASASERPRTRPWSSRRPSISTVVPGRTASKRARWSSSKWAKPSAISDSRLH